jgi:flavin-dependent dehydrogenase
MLAAQGFQVLLLEREKFPRDHVGESMLPASIPVLQELGVLERMEEAGFLPKYGATMVWGKDESPWSWYFEETNTKYPHSYQVWRPQFDQILLDNSRRHGVDVREGHRVVEVIFESGRATGVKYQDEDGALHRMDTSFVVDASGQGGVLATSLGLRNWDPFFRNLAVYGYYTGAKRLPGRDETNIFIEAHPRGWVWNIPLHTGWASIGAVVDSESGQEGVSKHGLRDFLHTQLRAAPHVSEMLEDAALVSGPFIVKDWSYVCERLVGDGYVLAGDAACFVDPLFSSGVHLAMMSGVLAAAYAATALKDPELAEAAGDAYQELYFKEYSHFRELARLFYSSNLASEGYFWEARRLLEREENYSPRHSFIQAVAGQPPRGYERVVLERGEAPQDFLSSVKEVESERAIRISRWDEAISRARAGEDGLLQAVPRLSAGVEIQRKAVLGEGEFVWGAVLTTVSQPEGTPSSGLVARLVSMIDGDASVGQLLTAMRSQGDPSQADLLDRSVLTTLQILFVDGTIESLKGL